MEKLICKSLLWKIGLTTGEDYNIALDEMFIKNSDSDLLLKLEYCSSNSDITADILKKYWIYEYKNFTVDAFGKCLLQDLKAIYLSNVFTIQDYAKKCCSLWQELPSEINTAEPFHVLSYADDPLSWNDETQTRKIYEELFNFYN